MLHLGDITKINGAEAPAVDVVIGGSPCQDLSVAGKRAGLAGARSGLYMEQIRCIKEMREHDRRMGRTGEFIRPRYMVWENVPGAFSSNGGRDFAAVLEEVIRIAEPEAPGIEVPEKGWNTWGGYHDEVGGRWSVAWRVLDAQHWGVPQRRRRIALVADFGGDTAWEISFEQQSVSGNITEGGAPGEGPAGDSERGSAYAVRIRGGCDGGGKGALVQTEKSGTLGTGNDQTLFCIATQQGGAEVRSDDRAPTLTASAGMSGNNQPVICLQGNAIDRADTAGCNGKGWKEDVCYTLNTIDRPAVAYSFDSLASNSMKSANPHSGCREVEIAKTLDTSPPDPAKNQGGIAILDALPFDTTQITSPENRSRPEFGKPCHTLQADAHVPCAAVMCLNDQGGSMMGVSHTDMTAYVASVDCRNFTEGGETNGTLQAKESGGQSMNLNNTVCQNMVVRRLTPLECERLQGFPDGWTDIGEWTDSRGKRHKDADSPRYKALGNSIALPPWKWLLKRLCGNYERDATMASLFDGIGGFPLI